MGTVENIDRNAEPLLHPRIARLHAIGGEHILRDLRLPAQTEQTPSIRCRVPTEHVAPFRKHLHIVRRQGDTLARHAATEHAVTPDDQGAVREGEVARAFERDRLDS